MALSVSEEQVAALVSPEDAIQAVRAAHLALSRGAASNVVRTRARSPKMSLQTMSAISLELGFAACKVYTARAGNMHSVVLLFNAPAGELVALIDSNELGRLRTTAASALAATVLTPPGVRTLLVIGSGFQAEGILKSYVSKAAGFTFTELMVYSRRLDHCKAFAARMSEQLQANVVAVDDPAVACQRADIVITATTASEPVVSVDWLTNVHHISAIGSNSLARRELPPRVINQAVAVVVDDIDVAKVESGNLVGPIETGKLQWSGISTLGDVLDHKKKISIPSSGATIFLSHGLAIQDLYLAAEVYRRAV